MLKNQKGITLVALVITIVILIILATVSITLALNSGLIDNAKYGADKYKEEATKESTAIEDAQEDINTIFKELNIVPGV